MKFICTFKDGKQNPKLVRHIAYQLRKLEKFERRSCKAYVSVTTERHLLRIDVLLRGLRVDMSASSSDENPYHAIDSAMARIGTQLKKRRGRIRGRRLRKLDSRQRQAPAAWEFDDLRGALDTSKKAV